MYKRDETPMLKTRVFICESIPLSQRYVKRTSNMDVQIGGKLLSIDQKMWILRTFAIWRCGRPDFNSAFAEIHICIFVQAIGFTGVVLNFKAERQRHFLEEKCSSKGRTKFGLHFLAFSQASRTSFPLVLARGCAKQITAPKHSEDRSRQRIFFRVANSRSVDS